MNEIWKDITGYEGVYQVSNLGNVKSLSREKQIGKGSYTTTETILKFGRSREYLNVSLYLNGKPKTFKVHQLVAMSFLNHFSDGTQNLVVDHINNNPLDNRLKNLQVITQRQNATKDKINKTSKYTGVCWHKATNKWRAKISKKYKSYWLGVFDTEEEAYEAYNKALKNIL